MASRRDRRASRRRKAALHRRWFPAVGSVFVIIALTCDAYAWWRDGARSSQLGATFAETDDDDVRRSRPSDFLEAPLLQSVQEEEAEGRRLATNSSSSSSKNKKSPVYFPDAFIRKKNRGDQNGNRKFVFLHALGVIYMFLALMIVCDNFFGPALDCMVEKWDIDDDVAGATFMAAGGSAPELATSYMGQFVSKSDIGFGTIVGSAVFNVLFVIACCALVVPGGCVPLTWWPLFRDCSYYILGLLTLAMFVRANDNIVWYEAALLFLGYVGYVSIMRYNHLLEHKFADLFHAHPGPHCSKVTPTAGVNGQAAVVSQQSASSAAVSSSSSSSGADQQQAPQQPSLSTIKVVEARREPSSESPSADVAPNDDDAVDQPQRTANQRQVAPTTADRPVPATGNSQMSCSPDAADDEDDGWEDPWAWPDAWHEQAVYVLCAPLKVCLYGTLYDCAHPDKQKYFLFTFGGSLVWLSIFAYGMVVWTTIVGSSLGICDYIMGLTVLAAGTSIPDALSSMYMAREGRGDMAISSSIGSNVFDILVGLPVPVLTKYFFVAVTGQGEGAWSFTTDGIVWDTITLLCMVAGVVTSIAKLGWVLNLKLGAVMFVFYFFFLVTSIIRNWKSCLRSRGGDDDD